MRYGNIFMDVANAVIMACHEDLSDYTYEYRKPGKEHYETRKRRPRQDDVDVYVYPQGFSDTSLGRGGVAGQMMSSCYTIAIVHGKEAAVYRGSRLDYVVLADERFWELLREHNLPEFRGYSRELKSIRRGKE